MRRLKNGIHRVSGKDVLVNCDLNPTEDQPASENTGPSDGPVLPGIPSTCLKEGVHRISGQDVLVEPETTTPEDQPGAPNPKPAEDEEETTLEKKFSKLANDATKTDPQNSRP